MHLPARSVSLPTRLIHPKAQRFEEKLKKIQASNSSSSSASSLIKHGLTKLVELYDFVNEQVICSPQGQQALRLCHNKKLVEHALDESIFLLDLSDFTRDLIGMFMEQIQQLQSALRRRRGDFSFVQSEIKTYVSFQKQFKDAAKRRLKSLSRTQTKIIKQSSSYLDQQSSMVSNILRQSNASTISIFRLLLQFLSSSGENQSDDGEEKSMIRSLFGRIISRRMEKINDAQTMLGRLALLNLRLEAIKDELSYLSRRLIQHRASLLNIVSP